MIKRPCVVFHQRYSSDLRRLAFVGVVLGLSGIVGRAAEPAPLELLVVAPHSDDEAIGCTGVILRAVAQKKRVGIVVVTAGDGHVRAAAAHAAKPIEQLVPEDFKRLATLRQRHTLEAMPRLGVDLGDIYFLGYPDGGLAAMYEARTNEAFRHPHTQRTQTYGVAAADYHTKAHGRAADYLRRAVVDDLAEIVRTRRPSLIYCTHEVDTHADHRTTFRFVVDAAKAVDFQGRVLTFVVHGREPSSPPDVVVQLTDAELKTKRATLELYQAGVAPVHDDLAEHYTRPEERFWAYLRP